MQKKSNAQVDSKPVVTKWIWGLLLVETMVSPTMLLGELRLLEEHRAATGVLQVIDLQRC